VFVLPRLSANDGCAPRTYAEDPFVTVILPFDAIDDVATVPTAPVPFPYTTCEAGSVATPVPPDDTGNAEVRVRDETVSVPMFAVVADATANDE